MINQSGFSKQLLSHANGLDCLLNFAFQIVALIDHVRDVGLLPGFPLVIKNLMENSKHLVGIDGTDRKVIVGITAVVEMKSSEHLFREQPSHNLLNILRM